MYWKYRKYTSNENYEIIVIDNNSNEETTNWLKLQYDIKLQLNTTNNGFPGGCNDGIKFANPMNDILLLNNDIVPYTLLMLMLLHIH